MLTSANLSSRHAEALMGRWNGNAGFGQAAFGLIRTRRFDDVRSSSLNQQRAGV